MICNCGRIVTRLPILGLCNTCGARKWRAENIDRARELSRNYYHRLKQRVIDFYSGQCQCCGETALEFLSLHHKNGDGSEHRKTVKSGYQMYRWVVINNFPDSIELLCHNCNMSLGAFGYCPHQTKEINNDRTMGATRLREGMVQ